jgi:hypothetical protein
MTYEQWVNATKKGISLGDDAENGAVEDAATSIDVMAFDAFSGGIEEEEDQKPEALKKPDPPSPPGPRGIYKKSLGQPSLSK